MRATPRVRRWPTLVVGVATIAVTVAVPDSAGATGVVPDPPTAVVAGPTSTAPQAVSAVDGTCEITLDGAAYCWGDNREGQLGDGTTSNSAYPVAVTGLSSGVTAIAGGPTSCAIQIGTLYCWGDNTAGQLGNGTTTSSSVPVAVTINGSTTGVTAVSTGGKTVCAIQAGAAYCWGSNLRGQLGSSGAPLTEVTVPTPVTGLSSGVSAISTGGATSCAVQSGAAYCWGDNSRGELGTSTAPLAYASSPKAIVSLTTGVSAVSVGASTACALVGSGADCWGSNRNGETGRGTASNAVAPVAAVADPSGVGVLSGVTAIAAGSFATCAVAGGAGYCWGNGSLGQLGNASTASVSLPTQVFGFGSGVTSIGRPQSAVCGIQDQAVSCWGDNSDGVLGTSVTNSSSTPAPIVAEAATISWTAPVDQGDTAITSYTATASPGGSTCTAIAPLETCTLAGLSLGSSYTFTVVATNGAGPSSPSTPSASLGTEPAIDLTSLPNKSGYGANWTGALSGTALAGGGATVSSVTVQVEDLSTTPVSFLDGATSSWSTTPATIDAIVTPGIGGAATWSTPIAPSLLTSPHRYAVTPRATDSGALSTIGFTTTFAYDTTSPTVTVGTPANGTTIGGSWSGVLKGTAAADGPLRVSSVTVTIEDTTAGSYWSGSTWVPGPAATSLVASGTTSWNVPLGTSSLSTGHSYAITPVATDSGGNVSASSTASFSFTSQPPIVVVVTPSGGVGGGWTGRIAGTSAAASGLVVTKIHLQIEDTTTTSYWNGASWVATPTTLRATGTSSWSYPLARRALSEGHNYVVSTQGSDSGGNTGGGGSGSWTYLAMRPTLSITTPATSALYGTNWPGAIGGTSAPGEPNLAIATVVIALKDLTVGLFWNGTGWQAPRTVLGASGTTSWGVALASASLSSGHSYRLVAIATDTAGNAVTRSRLFSYDERPAVITSAASLTVIHRNPFSFKVVAAGPKPSTFTEVGALPVGVTFKPTGLLSGRAVSPGTFTIMITAIDGISTPGPAQSFTLTVT